LDQLSVIFARVFDLSPGDISDEIERGKLEAWDSLNHLLLISEIEQELGIEFTSDEVLRIRTLKDIRQIVSKK
jgi:acyl carrier protein